MAGGSDTVAQYHKWLCTCCLDLPVLYSDVPTHTQHTESHKSFHTLYDTVKLLSLEFSAQFYEEQHCSFGIINTEFTNQYQTLCSYYHQLLKFTNTYSTVVYEQQNTVINRKMEYKMHTTNCFCILTYIINYAILSRRSKSFRPAYTNTERQITCYHK